MEPKKQNLIIFFEENDDEKDISSNLVRLYMNRFIINEEDQCEVSGVYELAKPDKNVPMIEFYNASEFKMNIFGSSWTAQIWKQNSTKLENDRSVVEESVSQLIMPGSTFPSALLPYKENVRYFHHFIIGTSFYINSSKRRRSYFKKVISEWINTKRLGSTVKSANVTFLRGYYGNLISANQLESAHRSCSETSTLPINYDLGDFYKMYSTLPDNINTKNRIKLISKRPIGIVTPYNYNDVAIKRPRFIHPGSLLVYTPYEKFQPAFSYKQLTDTEIDELKAFQHLKERQEQGWKTYESLGAILSLFERSDPEYQFIQCECQRFSFLVESEEEQSSEFSDKSPDQWARRWPRDSSVDFSDDSFDDDEILKYLL